VISAADGAGADSRVVTLHDPVERDPAGTPGGSVSHLAGYRRQAGTAQPRAATVSYPQ
jgi:hypothetical protein